MEQTAVEWLIEKLKDMEYDLRWIPDIIQQAKEMEKEQTKQIREMLMQGALTNMSCSSAIVEFDKLILKKPF